jgi:hypothetical protein
MRFKHYFVLFFMGLFGLSLLPPLTGLLDMTWWFYFDKTLSGIEWTEKRGFFAFYSPIFGGMMLLASGMIVQ